MRTPDNWAPAPLRLLQALSLISLLRLPASAQGAYMQHRDCPAAAGGGDGDAILANATLPSRFRFDALAGFLEGGSQLTIVTWGSFANQGLDCVDDGDLATARAELTMRELGSSHTYMPSASEVTCLDDAPTAPDQQQQLSVARHKFRLVYDIDSPALLSTFDIQVGLRDLNDGLLLGCMEAPLTPDVGAGIYWTSLVAPLLIFCVCLVAAVCVQAAGIGRRGGLQAGRYGNGLRIGDDEYEYDEEDEHDDARENQTTPPPPPPSHRRHHHLTRIADCLSYIQFIFFSASLTLAYPGFLRAAASPSSWSVLMLPRGPIFTHTPLSGVADGLYEVNGTFGGTGGFDIMTQVLGAPTRDASWPNIISLAVVVFVSLAAVVVLDQRLTTTASPPPVTQSVLWTTVRAFLSYFLFPISAWASYSLHRLGLFPVYYIVLTCLVISAMAVAFSWSFTRSRPENMGYLLISPSDESKQAAAASSSPSPSRSSGIAGPRSVMMDVYTVVTFVLLLARGVFTGGLQMHETAQLGALLACEALQIGCVACVLTPAALASRSAVVAYARSTVLLLCVSMLHPLRTLSVSSACGYVVLGIHVLVLVGLFLGPAVCDILRVAVRPSTGASSEAITLSALPQVYGLRQLRRRPTTRTDIHLPGTPDPSLPSPIIPDGTSDSSIEPVARHSLQHALPCRSASTDLQHHFFRPPRANGSVLHLNTERSSSSSSSSPPGSSGDSPSSSSTSQQQSRGLYAEFDDKAPAASASSMEHILPPTPTPGVDYSVREADMYYVKPRKLEWGGGGADEDGEDAARANVGSRLKRVLRRSGGV